MTEILRCMNCRWSFWPQHAEGLCTHDAALMRDTEGQTYHPATTRMRLKDAVCGHNAELFQRKE